jgi:hypothetical protein
MHIQTLSWARLPKAVRDSMLLQHGLTQGDLSSARQGRPRARLIEAAGLAFKIDDEPNSDLIDFIAGYEARSGLYHYFKTVGDLLSLAADWRMPTTLSRVPLGRGELDLAATVPQTMETYPVHMECKGSVRQFLVWQKVNGGMRLVTLNRVIPVASFLSGVLLYAGEGTKSLSSGRVELANSNTGILRLYMRFLTDLGVSKETLRARVQIHDISEDSYARNLWAKELSLAPEQFVRPLLSVSGKKARRKSYTLQVSYLNTMLLMLLRYWTTNLESIIGMVEQNLLS